MKNIKFLPWVGSNYQRGISGKRVLILGDSHYCARLSDATPQLTQNIIEDLFDSSSAFEHYKNTYTKFERSLAGHEIDQSDKRGKRKVWNDVMFYNYVQEALSGPREAPSARQFSASEAPFFEVLNHYKPHKIIAWGTRLYNHLPQKGKQLPDLVDHSNTPHEVWSYTLNNGQTVEVIQCVHPSAGFSWDYWHEVFKQFINR